MKNLYYSPLDLAVMISIRDFGEKGTVRFIDSIWEKERAFLLKKYRNDKRLLILDIYYWLHYLNDNGDIDSEFPAIQMDMQSINSEFYETSYISDFSDLDLFFKNMRIRIVLDGKKDYVVLKLRTLIKQYGYQRRSQKLLSYINDSMRFYHLKSYLRGGVECNIEDADIDEMLTFRID